MYNAKASQPIRTRGTYGSANAASKAHTRARISRISYMILPPGRWMQLDCLQALVFDVAEPAQLRRGNAAARVIYQIIHVPNKARFTLREWAVIIHDHAL